MTRSAAAAVDPVVSQVLVRFAEAEQIAVALSRRAVGAVAGAVPRGAVTVINPSPTARTGLVEAELLVPETWESVALELPDGRRIATQELSRKEPILFDESLRGDEVDDLFRRFHGREVFDHAWNGYRIEGRTITLEVDTDPDPAWLDVDGLQTEVETAMRAAPDEMWQIRIVARPRRTLAASVPAPALGWTAVRAVEGRAEPVNPVRVASDDRTIANGLLTVAVHDDGTLRLETPDGVVADGVGRIVDGGDFGDSYNYGPPASELVVDTPSSVAVRADLAGPVRGRLTITRRFEWPSGVLERMDRRGRPRRRRPTSPWRSSSAPTSRSCASASPSSTTRTTIAFASTPRCLAARTRRTPRANSRWSSAGMIGEGGYREEPLATYPAHGWVDAGGMADPARPPDRVRAGRCADRHVGTSWP